MTTTHHRKATRNPSHAKSDVGFGVGHVRDTKTKGIQLHNNKNRFGYGEDINGVKTSIFYLDTEGFESIGKSNVYEDRYVTSQLSLAVELAEEFYGRQDVALEPAKLRWLIQRDFLQGKSVKEMVDEALRHAPISDG
ncbi:hypothetical protein L2E82_48902 [Cichorium intybus]|uniref:Uncharacterized protein n=1 Tax=Cichorium intybus TaxID=13427 RepID=A0ACB8YZF9_CICIN|nr:hypothetical protein L2E82_48902 [Cichorium intybus]